MRILEGAQNFLNDELLEILTSCVVAKVKVKQKVKRAAKGKVKAKVKVVAVCAADAVDTRASVD